MTNTTDDSYYLRGGEYAKKGSEWHKLIDLVAVDWEGPALDLYHDLGNILMMFPDCFLDRRYGMYGAEDKLCFSGTTEVVTDEKIIDDLNKQVEKRKLSDAALKKKKTERERKEYERLAKKYGPKK